MNIPNTHRICLCLSVLLIFWICGCATSGRIGSTRDVSEDCSYLTLIRPPSTLGNLATYYVTLNGEDVFALRSGEYTKLTIPAGKHLLALKFYGERSSPAPAEGIPFEVSTGATVYFTITTACTAQATLKRITDDQGYSEIERCGYIPENRLSNRE